MGATWERKPDWLRSSKPICVQETGSEGDRENRKLEVEFVGHMVQAVLSSSKISRLLQISLVRTGRSLLTAVFVSEHCECPHRPRK
jgi:hypothetical protein